MKAIDGACAADDVVRDAFPDRDVVTAVIGHVEMEIAASGAALQGSPALAGDREAAKCHAAIGKARSAVAGAALTRATKCQKAIDGKADTFGHLAEACALDAGSKAASAGRSVTKACRRKDGTTIPGADVQSCDALPSCMVEAATATGRRIARAVYGDVRGDGGGDCAPGVFLMMPPSGVLVPGATGLLYDAIVTTESESGPTVAIDSGCAPTSSTSTGASFSVTFGAACAGVAAASLEAAFDASCDVVTGTFTADGAHRSFVALRARDDVETPTLGHPSLDVYREEEQSSSLLIGPAGGEISARSYGGARFRLIVPPGALLTPTTITMTPAVVEGAPLTGGVVAAVDLQPSGLTFLKPALLFLAPGQTPIGPTATFGWSGPDDTFALAPGVRSGDNLRTVVEVTHFSGYGLALPGPSELSSLIADMTTLIADTEQFREGYAAALHSYYAGAVDLSVLYPVFIQWHATIVEPRLAVAASSPLAAILAHHAVRTWLAYVTHFFSYADPSLPEELRERWIAVIYAQSQILAQHFSEYTRPRCSVTVAEWKDWIRVPEELRLAAASTWAPDSLRAHGDVRAPGRSLLRIPRAA